MKARSRLSWPISLIRRRGWCAPGPTLSDSVVVSASSAGPGETQIESDRRLLQERMTKIELELEGVKRMRGPASQEPQRCALSDCRAGRLHQRG